MAQKPLTVTSVNNYIRNVLLRDPLLGVLRVEGEIASLKVASSGHWYFTITDGKSSLSCILWANKSARLTQSFKAGDKVILSGSIQVYAQGGSYSLHVESIEASGAGDLAKEFELLKARLLAEGLFDEKHKKPIPEHPKKVGVVTSRTGAAIEDIIETATIRNKDISIMVFPVSVQGDNAPGEIAAMIDLVSEKFSDKIDTLIVGRGGGSPEDLKAFNDEGVARSIYHCRVPVISAVGHEIDFSISDFVADARAATPTAAAQMAVPDMRVIVERIEKCKRELRQALSNKIIYYDLQVSNLKNDMENKIKTSLSDYSHRLERAEIILSENNPYKILGKGYAVVSDGEKAVTSVKDLSMDKEYRVTFKDGHAAFKLVRMGDEAHGE